MKIKQSETIIIKRSQVNFAAYNPRKQDKKVVERLKRNFKKVGFLGGIVWNERSGNLVGGHKRVETLDLIFDYPKNDYDLKVEKVDLDEKTEKEQNIFLNSKNAQGETDLEKLAELLPDIDIEDAAITEYDIGIIEAVVPDFSFGKSETLKDGFNDLKQKSDQEKAKTKESRKKIKQDTTDDRMPFYFTVTFDSYSEKAEYLESIGINGDTVFVTAEKFINAATTN